jgi:regulator of replication initiation timing
MLAPAALFLVGLSAFLGACLLLALAECRQLRRERDRLAELNARLNWENDGLTRRLAEKTRAVGRLLQTLAGDGTRRN